jgi:hypothetical protein
MPKLLDQVCEVIQMNFDIRIEQEYVNWIKLCIARPLLQASLQQEKGIDSAEMGRG